MSYKLHRSRACCYVSDKVCIKLHVWQSENVTALVLELNIYYSKNYSFVIYHAPSSFVLRVWSKSLTVLLISRVGRRRMHISYGGLPEVNTTLQQIFLVLLESKLIRKRLNNATHGMHSHRNLHSRLTKSMYNADAYLGALGFFPCPIGSC
jgi:hypothetical protein